MPFGLKNGPETFQRAIDVILTKVRWKYSFVYLDDVIMFSPDAESHFMNFVTVLQMTRLAGIAMKLSESFFFHETVSFLGHVTLEKALRRHTIKMEQHPTTVTERRSFLGLCNVYRRFVPNFATISYPLKKKLKRGQHRELDPFNRKEERVENPFRDCLIGAPILELLKVGCN